MVMKFVLRFLLPMIIIFLIAELFVGNYFYDIAILSNNRNDYISLEDQIKQKNFNYLRYDLLANEEFKISSKYGYKLSGIYLQDTSDSDNTVIICHGLGANKWRMLPLADMYLDFGWNVVLYDHRNHGDSGGEDISYGYYEKDDLQTIVEYVKQKNPDETIIVHGESLGAATALQHAYQNESSKDVSLYVSDCGYSDLNELFSHRLSEDYNLPNIFFVEFASLFAKLRAGFYFGDVSPIEHMKEIDTPILFIHGGKDDYVPTYMSEEMFERKTGDKKLFIVPDAGHAESFTKDRNGYVKAVGEFLSTFVVL